MAITAGAIFSTLSWGRVIVFQNRCHHEAEEFAFDQIWNTFNMDWDDLINLSKQVDSVQVESVNPNTLLAKYNGIIATAVYDETSYLKIEVIVKWNNVGSSFKLLPPEEKLVMHRYKTVRGL